MTHNLELSKRFIELAVKTVRLANLLPDTPVGQFAAKQLLTHGTAPATLLAGNREKDADVLAKSLDAVQQTTVWLTVILEAELAPTGRVRALLRECEMDELALSTALKRAQTKA